MPTPEPPYEGACRCGETRFRLHARPMIAMACHCTGCQKMTSGPYSLSAAVAAEAFEVTAGEPVVGGLRGASRHSFCPSCLSWLFTRPEGLDWMVNVRTPMLGRATAAALPPFVETYTCEQLPFAASGAPRSYPRFPPAEDFPELLAAYAAWTGGAA